MTYPTSPGGLGHEGWGSVDAIAPDVKSVKVGDRVATLFTNSFAEYDVGDASAVVKLPSSLARQPFPGEPLGCAMNILNRSAIKAGHRVAIIGIGFLGALLTRLAVHAGAEVIAVSRRQASLDLAREMGAVETVLMDDHASIICRVGELTARRFCDRVVEATGKQWPLDLAGELVREGGRLIIAGYHQDGPRQVNMQQWNWKGIDVINAHERDPSINVQGVRDAIAAVAAGILSPERLYTHRYSLSELGAALEATAPTPGRIHQSPGPDAMMPAGNAIRLASRPRLGFLGVGWIGRNRMEAILDSGLGEACAICDPSAEMMAAARTIIPTALPIDTLQQLLDLRLDGIVIATPSAVHAEQSVQALASGAAVFCQKPLGRNRVEVEAVLEAARGSDRLIGVDFSYRHTAAMQTILSLLREDGIGDVYAADLVFHNAYGPDKPWFYDAALSGGGCVMDLGVHLVDLLLWTLDFPAVNSVHASLFSNGRKAAQGEVEDYAVATLSLGSGQVARLACSWRLHAGCDAVIDATFHGTKGALRILQRQRLIL